MLLQAILFLSSLGLSIAQEPSLKISIQNQCLQSIYVNNTAIPGDTTEDLYPLPFTTLAFSTIEDSNVSTNTLLSYSLDYDTDLLWYNISGTAFAGRKLSVTPEGGEGCEELVWPYGVAIDGGKTGGQCTGSRELVVEVCAGKCLPSWSPCGNNAGPNNTRACCTHCIGSHHCVAAPGF